MPEPSRIRLVEGYGSFPPYTLENAPRWDDFEPMLEESRNYWLSATGPVGPVVAPVWGVWFDGTFFFSTDPKSQKARALARNLNGVINLESGDDVMIVHGRIELISASVAMPYIEIYRQKYGIEIDPTSPGQALFRMIPAFALTWLERDFEGTATRWEF